MLQEPGHHQGQTGGRERPQKWCPAWIQPVYETPSCAHHPATAGVTSVVSAWGQSMKAGPFPLDPTLRPPPAGRQPPQQPTPRPRTRQHGGRGGKARGARRLQGQAMLAWDTGLQHTYPRRAPV